MRASPSARSNSARGCSAQRDLGSMPARNAACMCEQSSRAYERDESPDCGSPDHTSGIRACRRSCDPPHIPERELAENLVLRDPQPGAADIGLLFRMKVEPTMVRGAECYGVIGVVAGDVISARDQVRALQTAVTHHLRPAASHPSRHAASVPFADEKRELLVSLTCEMHPTEPVFAGGLLASERGAGGRLHATPRS